MNKILISIFVIFIVIVLIVIGGAIKAWWELGKSIEELKQIMRNDGVTDSQIRYDRINKRMEEECSGFTIEYWNSTKQDDELIHLDSFDELSKVCSHIDILGHQCIIGGKIGLIVQLECENYDEIRWG